jgi:formylglycine-generating enzyme required for sulfatase activity
MKRTLSVILLLLLVLAMGPSNMLAQSEAGNRKLQELGAESRSPSESKLFEAINSYIDGMKGSSHDREARASGKKLEQRRSPDLIAQRDESDQIKQALESEEALARRRIQNLDWDLASTSLQRAFQLASSIPEPDRASAIKEKIGEVQAKASADGQNNLQKGSELTNSIGMVLVNVPAGSFQMGSSSAETRRIRSEWNIGESLLEPETPDHKVRLTNPYLIGKHEVTVRQFRQFVTETGYKTVAETQGWAWAYDADKRKWVKKTGASWKNSSTKMWDDLPATFMTIADAQAFCGWLSSRDGRKYGLPTEAQWEYAARGGESGKRFPWGDHYPGGSNLNMADSSSPYPWADRTTNDGQAVVAPVGLFEPNGLNLYDMSGNAWELCADVYDAKAYKGRGDSTTYDPVGPKTGK